MKILNKDIIFISFMLIFLGGCGTTSPSVREQNTVYTSQETADLPSIVFLKSDETINKPAPFFGVLKTDTGRTGANILYQGVGGLAGLFAQVFTHAAIESEAQKQALQKAQDEADLVLKGYADLTEKNTILSLVQNSAAKLSLNSPTVNTYDASFSDNNVLVLESLPIYYLSQDQQSLVLEHQVKAYYAQEPEKLVFQNMAKVISRKQIVENENNPWKADNGKLFIETTSDLHLSSLRILLKDMYKNLGSQEKDTTHKYYIGEKKYYMRGKIVYSDCDYKVIRNLKGNILIFQTEPSASCQS